MKIIDLKFDVLLSVRTLSVRVVHGGRASMATAKWRTPSLTLNRFVLFYKP